MCSIAGIVQSKFFRFPFSVPYNFQCLKTGYCKVDHALQFKLSDIMLHGPEVKESILHYK